VPADSDVDLLMDDLIDILRDNDTVVIGTLALAVHKAHKLGFKYIYKVAVEQIAVHKLLT
jgi:site-specific recombinase